MTKRFLGAIALGSLLASVAFVDSAKAAMPAFFESQQAAFARARERALVPANADLAPADRGVASDVAHARGLRDFGTMRATSPVEIGLLLRLRNEAELRQLTLAQGNAHSAYYHKYLSTAQFNTYFSPDVATYKHTLATLQRRGFRITAVYPNRTFIRAIAPSATVGRYFSTSFHAYVQAGQKGMRYGNVSPAVMPDELKRDVVDISGLHTIVTMHEPIRFADKSIVMQSAQFKRALAQVRALRADRVRTQSGRTVVANGGRRPFNVPTPLSTATPMDNPSPDPTLSPGTPAVDYVDSIGGYDPTIYADAYDYPVQHGYGGRNHGTASVISSDFADSDAASEYKTFGIPRTGKTYRECGDPSGGATCGGLIGAGDADGESTLDALVITSLAPASDFYEYLTDNGLSDIGIESDYILANNQNVAEVVNSSFGGCETDDPGFGYATNYIAMEGAALGITYSASTGDTGSTECGTEVMNGAPAEYINISDPSSGTYFTADGGTDFEPLATCTGVLSACYTDETGWTFGGGGVSVILPMPAWQAPVVNGLESSTSGRNTPDVVFTADELPPGVGMDVFLNGSQAAVGGTSVASPMFTAMQAEINQVQNSRNGWVNPGLYAAFEDFNTTTVNFAFRDITGGTNVRYQAVPGYDDATGLGSPIGWNLAAVENGYPGATPRPGPVTPPPSPVASATASGPSPTPSPTPTIAPTPHPSGSADAVTTIAGSGCPGGMPDAVASMAPVNPGNMACFDGPTGILYVASNAVGTDTQSTTDNYLFVNDFVSGYVRAIDLTAAGKPAYTMEDRTFDNAARAATQGVASNLYGLSLIAESEPLNAGLIVAAGGDNDLYKIALPTTPDPSTTPGPEFKAITNVTASLPDAAGIELGVVNGSNGNFTDEVFSETGYLSESFTTGLPAGGNFGLTQDAAAPLPNFVIADSGKNSVVKVNDNVAAATVTPFASGAPLNLPKEITYLSGTSAFYVANCGGNDIVRISSTGAMTVVAGDGAARELDGVNTGAEFDCPFGITNDGTNLYVTDLGGNSVREITNVQ